MKHAIINYIAVKARRNIKQKLSMESGSYNENQAKQIALKHIFYPGTYGLVSEAIVAFIALILFNISDFNNQLLGSNLRANPFSLWQQPLQHIFDKINGFAVAQRIVLFLLWSIVGVLLYILVFRTLQMVFNVKQSVGSGVQMVREDQERGFVRWLASLHDFFVRMIVFLAGVAAVAAGSLICFGIASQELRNGLVNSFPTNLGAFFLSFLGALLSVRLVALGLTLASRHFRNWYLY